MNIKTVSFLGGHAISPESQMYKEATEIAKLCAKSGLIVLNGGGPGIMKAATDGAHLGGGVVVGITTYLGGVGRSNYEGTDPNNKFDKEIIEEDYFDRTKRLLREGDVHIIFKGGEGTISEFGMTWAMSRIHEGFSKPIILYGLFWKNIMKAFEDNMFIRQGSEALYHIVDNPNKVMEVINIYRTER